MKPADDTFGRAVARRPTSPRARPTSPRTKKPVAKPVAKPAGSKVQVKPDRLVPFPAAFVHADNLTALRKYVADEAKKWLREQLKQGRQGAVVFDIDDTLINGNEAVANGFEHMVDLYKWASQHFPVELVTARPADDKANVMRLLHKRGLCVGFDHLHMMVPAEYNSGESTYVKDFKWRKHQDFVRRYGRVLARLGDRLWDVAERQSPNTYLKHVGDEVCYVFTDPILGGTKSFKLPEGGRRR
jgi:hypothetical protein